MISTNNLQLKKIYLNFFKYFFHVNTAPKTSKDSRNIQAFALIRAVLFVLDFYFHQWGQSFLRYSRSNALSLFFRFSIQT